MWTPHHTWAGAELFRIAVDLRGFYLKVSSRVPTANVQLWPSARALLALSSKNQGPAANFTLAPCLLLSA